MRNKVILLAMILVTFSALTSCGADTPKETNEPIDTTLYDITESMSETESVSENYVETETVYDETDETLEYEDPLLNFDDSAYEENINEKEVMLTVPDNSKKITALVDKYLSKGDDSVYDELFDIVYHEYTAMSDIYFKVGGGGMTSYYRDKDTKESYYLPLKDEGLDTYYLVRYGEMDTFQEIDDYLRMHFAPAITKDLIEHNTTVTECNGKFYGREGSLGSYNFERDPVYTMYLFDEIILWECVRTSYTGGSDIAEPTGRHTYYYSILKKYPSGSWLWGMLEFEGQYMVEEYEDYVDSKK